MKSLNLYLTESLDNTARIFIIIKPGFFKYAKQILDKFAESGWGIERQTSKKLTLKEAHTIYNVHKKEPWYKELCQYMASDITTGFMLIDKTRKMSPDIFKETDSIKDEIRDTYGESEMRNVMHSSSDMEGMKKEASIYFVF